jgi:hypothetical protein
MTDFVSAHFFCLKKVRSTLKTQPETGGDSPINAKLGKNGLLFSNDTNLKFKNQIPIEAKRIE